MDDKKEYKFIREIKAIEKESDGKMRFSGYLAYFDNVDSYGDVIVKGAFRNTLKEIRDYGRTLPVLEQHGGSFFNPNYTPIGYYESLKENNEGLFAEGVLIKTDRGVEVYTLLKELPPSTMGQSIGYKTIKAAYPDDEESQKKGIYRILKEVKLYEGSIVTFPANEAARVDDVKAASLFWRQMETHFRENGFSREDAKKAISLVKSSTPRNSFANFLASFGEISQADDEEPAKPDSIKGENELLAALNDAKKSLDIAELKKTLKGFSLK